MDAQVEPAHDGGEADATQTTKYAAGGTGRVRVVEGFFPAPDEPVARR
jgi:hypothetical protein